jgi:glycosyltransferase involved in cell wall biosynthesis
MASKTVSCLIPVFNEGDRLQEVLSVVCVSPDLKEVIVIDDGSEDETFRQASTFSVKIVRHKQNQGKAAAIRSGLKHATGDIILLIDGDLSGLTHVNLKQLLKPVRQSSGLSIALLRNTWPLFKLWSVDPWSGQRAMPRQILDEVFSHPDVKDQRYAIECHINQLALEQGLQIYSINWTNVFAVPKSDKASFGFHGWLKDWQMFWSIYASFGVFNTLKQQVLMPRVARKI